MYKIIIIFIIQIAFCSIAFSEVKGTVCLGKNLSIVISEHSKRLYLTVSESDKIFFRRPFLQPVISVQNLALNKDHLVKVYFDGKVVRSWGLNFSELNASTVVIWRSKGAWRMEPIEVSLCKK